MKSFKHWLFCLFILMSGMATANANQIKFPKFDGVHLDVICTKQPHCFYGQEHEIEIKLVITNNRATPVQMAVAFLQRTGPFIRLENIKTGQNFWLKTNLADHDLIKEMQVIAPNRSVITNWVIYREEIEAVSPDHAPVNADISYIVNVLENNRYKEYRLEQSILLKKNQGPASN